MATFAPVLPDTPIPDYKRGYSEPITQPLADKSAAITLSTLGNVGEGLINAAEYQDRYGINEKVRSGVDSLRDATTAAYEQIKNAQVTGQEPPSSAMQTAGFTGSLLGKVGADVPPGLQQGLQQAGVLGTAMAQGGATKANDTLYTGQLAALAKKLRAQYPGHRDYIDQEMQKYSGVNPANAYMSNLLQDINRNAVAANSGRNRLMSLAYSHEVQSLPGVLPYIKAYEMGLPGSEDNLESFINKNLSKDYIFKDWQHQREIKNAQKTDQTFDAKQQLQQESAAIAYRTFNSVLQIPGLTSPAMIQKMITDQQEGRLALTPQQHNQLLSAAVAAKNSFLNEVQKTARDRGYTTAINDPSAEKAIIDNEAQQFDRLIDSIKNKDYGSLFETQRRLRAIQDGDKEAIMTDPSMGPYWRMVDVIGGMPGGKDWLNRADSLGLGQGVQKNLQTWMNNAQKKAASPDDLRNDGTVKSMYSNIEELQKAQKQGTSIDPKVYQNVVHFVDQISDPKTPDAIKEEFAKYAFNENNFKTLDAFKMDFTDSNGKYHEGKYSVFDTLTQPKITQAISKMSPSTKNMYVNWGETSFAKLYREDLNTVSSLGVHPGLDMRILWDSNNNRFSLDDGKGDVPKPHTMVEKNYLDYSNKVINRLNSGLGNLSQIIKLRNSDPTAVSGYLLDTMRRDGFDPEHIEGFGADVYKAIENSKAKKDLSTAFEKASGKQ